MSAQLTPPVHDHGSDQADAEPDVDPVRSNRPSAPVRPAEAPRQQAYALSPSPGRMFLIGGGIASACAGGAVGYWLGRRRAPHVKSSLSRATSTVGAAVDLAPVALHLLANPLVRALLVRMLLRQISRKVEA